MLVRADEKTGLLAYTNATGVIAPVPHLAQLKVADFKEDSMLVAVVTVSGADYPDLGLSMSGHDSLFLFVDKDTANNDVWTAIMEDGTTSKALNVTRYTYNDSEPDSYPAVARWDTLGTKQVIGIRCGKAWCLVGAQATPEGADPDAPSGTPWSKRVRGFSDWKPHPNPKKKDSRLVVLAADSLRKQGRREYKGAFKHVATIYTSKTGQVTDSVDVLLEWHKPTGKTDSGWRLKYTSFVTGKDTIVPVRSDKYTKHRERDVPGVARWDASPLPKNLKASPNFEPLGNLWIRCANGCCEAEAYAPI